MTGSRSESCGSRGRGPNLPPPLPQKWFMRLCQRHISPFSSRTGPAEQFLDPLLGSDTILDHGSLVCVSTCKYIAVWFCCNVPAATSLILSCSRSLFALSLVFRIVSRWVRPLWRSTAGRLLCETRPEVPFGWVTNVVCAHVVPFAFSVNTSFLRRALRPKMALAEGCNARRCK